MAKYNNFGVSNAKELLTSRLCFIVNQRLKYTTIRALAERVGMARSIISKIKNGSCHYVSFDALLELAQRLNVRYSVNIEYNGTGNPKTKVVLEDIHPATANGFHKHTTGTTSSSTTHPA